MNGEEHPKKPFVDRVTGALKVGTIGALAGATGGAIAGRMTAVVGAGIGLDPEAIGELAEQIFENSDSLTNSLDETIKLDYLTIEKTLTPYEGMRDRLQTLTVTAYNKQGRVIAQCKELVITE